MVTKRNERNSGDPKQSVSISPVAATHMHIWQCMLHHHKALDEGVDHGENEDSWMRHFLTEMMKPELI